MSRQTFQGIVFLILILLLGVAVGFVEKQPVDTRPPAQVNQDEYQLNARERLANLNQRIKVLKARVNMADTGTEEDFRTLVTSIDDKRMKIEDLIDQLNRTAPEKSAAVKKKIDLSLNDLAYGVDRAEKNIQQ